MGAYDPAADPVHGSGWNSAARWGGWSWRKPRRGEFFRTCSFCGCIHPEDLAPEITPAGPCRICGEVGWEACFRSRPEHPYTPGSAYASWADRKYGWPHKFYVEGLKPRDPSLLHCIGHGSGGGGGGRKPDGGDWVAAADLTRAQKRIIRDDGMHAGEKFDGWYLFAPRASLHAKFYTIHLADPAVSQDVKDKIQQASGLRFTFTDDGKVSWQSWEEPS
jgi:hypothetical protein